MTAGRAQKGWVSDSFSIGLICVSSPQGVSLTIDHALRSSDVNSASALAA